MRSQYHGSASDVVNNFPLQETNHALKDSCRGLTEVCTNVCSIIQIYILGLSEVWRIYGAFNPAYTKGTYAVQTEIHCKTLIPVNMWTWCMKNSCTDITERILTMCEDPSGEGQ